MPSPPIPLSHLEGSPEPERRYRLLELVRRRMAELRYSPRSVTTYVSWIRRYVVFNDRRHPRDLGPDAVRRFLSHLARKEHVAAATQNQALAALTFLYDRVLGQPLERVDGIEPARRSRHVPVALSQHEVRSILAQLDDPARLCVSLLYGSGLRLSECLRLRVKDVDFDRHEVVVRGGKGGKDRRTPLADSTHGPLQRWLRGQKREFARDLRRPVGTTGVGDARSKVSEHRPRALTLVAALLAFAVAGYGYFMAIRRTSDAENAERIVTWGADANAEVWTPKSKRYRTMMRWGSPLGLVLFLVWAWLRV